MSDNARAIWLMVAAMAAFAVCDMFVKLAAESLGVGQIAVLLAAGSAALFWVALRREGGRLISPHLRQRAFLIRCVGEVVATTCVTVALALIPIVTFSSIIQAQPLAVTLGAALFLGERVGWRRWLSIFVGFLGVMIVLRPGAGDFEPAALWALAGVVGMTTRDLATRALPREISTVFAATWALLAVMAVGAVLVPLTGGWRAIDGVTGLYVAGMILSGALAYLSITLAMRVGEVSAIASFRYSRIVFAMLIGYLVFAERPDLWVWVGTIVIVLSGIYTLMRERRSRPAP